MSARRVLLVHGGGRPEGLCQHLSAFLRRELEASSIEVRVHDLLTDGFDPVLRLRPEQKHAEVVEPEQDALVARYQRDLAWADAYVIVHPVWWFAPPAILKGWVDRVVVDGIALSHATEPPRGLLGGRSALVIQTFKAPKIVDRLLMRRLSSRFWSKAVFFSVGITEVTPLALYDVGGLSEGRLRRFERRLRRALERTLRAGSAR